MGGKQQQHQQRWRKNKPESGSGADKSTSFRAPTPGYEKHIFTQGTNQDVTRFKDTQEKLSQYVATQNWKKGSELAKAITEMKEPVYTAPARPVRKHYKQGTNTETTDKVGEDGTPNIAVEDDMSWGITVGEYMDAKKTCDAERECWRENNTRGWALVMVHCTRELEAELKNSSRWEQVAKDRSVVGILEMIRDIAQKKIGNYIATFS